MEIGLQIIRLQRKFAIHSTPRLCKYDVEPLNPPPLRRFTIQCTLRIETMLLCSRGHSNGQGSAPIEMLYYE
jgi:hypothetical protein